MTRFTGQVAGRASRRGLLFLALVTASLLLTACGFHLRGAMVLPPQLERTQLTGTDPRGPLAEEIAATLDGAGARLVASDATALLHITQERFLRRVLTVGSTGRASEYELIYEVGFELRAPARVDESRGEKKAPDILVPAQTVTLTRDYVFDSTQVLGKGEEEEVLQREMRGFAVRQMLNRLQAALRERKAP